MCDRRLGHLMQTLRATGVLDEALVIVTSDHGHSLWERRNYIGKRGYPSDPESYDLPLLVRHPQRLGAGSVCNAFVQHHDISATLLEAAGVKNVLTKSMGSSNHIAVVHATLNGLLKLRLAQDIKTLRKTTV